MNFGSHVDGIVAVSAALVNAGTPGERQGRAYELPAGRALAADLGAVLRTGSRDAVDRRDAADPAPREAGAYVELAAEVRPVYERVEAGDFAGAAGAVNELLARYAPAPRLEQHDGEPLHLHFHGPRATDPTGWGGALAMGLATVLGSEYADRLGVCAAPACDRVFVDVSRNGTRRFCSEACQNRVKAAAHRARQRA